MNSERTEQEELTRVFRGNLPPSIESLLYMLDQLGSEPNPPLEESIRIIYRAFMLEVDEDLRDRFFDFIEQEVASRRLSAKAILAFVRTESNPPTVSRAVGAYLRHWKATFDEPFAAALVILNVLEAGEAKSPGAVFAGLVCFGDRRMSAIARSVREHMSMEDLRIFSLAVQGPLQRTTIEFCMEWLVQLMKRNRYELAMQVAYGLSSMVIKDPTRLIHDVRHNFGPFGFSGSNLGKPVPFAELLVEMGPLIEGFANGRLPALRRMMHILEDPATHELDALDQRKVSTRRTRSDRRVSDRRIVNIQPRHDRRAEQRRNGERRVEQRR